MQVHEPENQPVSIFKPAKVYMFESGEVGSSNVHFSEVQKSMLTSSILSNRNRIQSEDETPRPIYGESGQTNCISNEYNEWEHKESIVNRQPMILSNTTNHDASSRMQEERMRVKQMHL